MRLVTGFSGFGGWIGYNEAMILYILALGSPTHAIPANGWTAWTSGYDWLTYYGYTYINFPPLFGHQYSHCWIDFRTIQDTYTRNKGITYWENSRRATLAQRNYCIANPGGWVGYGEDLWGITASDDPDGYVAHGAPRPRARTGRSRRPPRSAPYPSPDAVARLHAEHDNAYAPGLPGPTTGSRMRST
jgi:hypothetical protein